MFYLHFLKPDIVAHHLERRKAISKKEKDKILKTTSEYVKSQQLIELVINSRKTTLHQFRSAIIRSGQANLLRYISETNTTVDNDGDDLMKAMKADV